MGEWVLWQSPREREAMKDFDGEEEKRNYEFVPLVVGELRYDCNA